MVEVVCVHVLEDTSVLNMQGSLIRWGFNFEILLIQLANLQYTAL